MQPSSVFDIPWSLSPCPAVPAPSLTGGPGQPRWYTRPRGEKAARAVETFNLKFGNDVLHIYRYRIAEKFPRNIWMKYPKSIWSATAVRLGFVLFLQKLRYQYPEAHSDPSMGIRLRTCFVTLLTPGRVVPASEVWSQCPPCPLSLSIKIQLTTLLKINILPHSQRTL